MISPPIAIPRWLPNPIVGFLQPVSIQGTDTAYDFPVPGNYTITVKQFCTDEERKEGTCCGSDICLELSYQLGEEMPLLATPDHRLTVSQPGEIPLELESFCRRDLDVERSIRWEFPFPDGSL